MQRHSKTGAALTITVAAVLALAIAVVGAVVIRSYFATDVLSIITEKRVLWQVVAVEGRITVRRANDCPWDPGWSWVTVQESPDAMRMDIDEKEWIVNQVVGMREGWPGGVFVHHAGGAASWDSSFTICLWIPIGILVMLFGPLWFWTVRRARSMRLNSKPDQPSAVGG